MAWTMPLFQYKCTKCDFHFEELVAKYDDKVVCPKCGAEAVKSYGGEMYSSTGKKRINCTGHCSTCDGCK